MAKPTSKAARAAALVAVPVLMVAGFASLAIAGGHRAAAGAGLGAVMLILFFVGGRAPMTLARSSPPGPLFVLISTGYVLRILLLLVVLKKVGHATWLDRSAVAVTVIAGAIAWTGWLVRRHMTSQQPTLELTETSR
jgi:hypothetical protein